MPSPCVLARGGPDNDWEQFPAEWIIRRAIREDGDGAAISDEDLTDLDEIARAAVFQREVACYDGDGFRRDILRSFIYRGEELGDGRDAWSPAPPCEVLKESRSESFQ